MSIPKSSFEDLLAELEGAPPFQAAKIARELELAASTAQHQLEAYRSSAEALRQAAEASGSFADRITQQSDALSNLQYDALAEAIRQQTEQFRRMELETHQWTDELLRQATESIDEFMKQQQTEQFRRMELETHRWTDELLRQVTESIDEFIRQQRETEQFRRMELETHQWADELLGRARESIDVFTRQQNDLLSRLQTDELAEAIRRQSEQFARIVKEIVDEQAQVRKRLGEL